MHYLFHGDSNHEPIQPKCCRISLTLNIFILIRYDIQKIEIKSKIIINITKDKENA
jgi:hypothetical protein